MRIVPTLPTSSETRAGCVLVGQTHQRLSDGLRGWLLASFEAVFIVADRPSLIEGARKLQPALVVIDLALADGKLAALLAELRRHAPTSRVLLLSDYDDPGVDAAALSAGADGVVRKATLATDLSAAVDAVLAGRRFTSPSGAR
jgi:DNA-binding NarL/FixJ family response regulator